MKIGPVRELDVDVQWGATHDDAMCAVPGDPEKCLGALAGLRRARIHGKRVLEIDVKATSVYMKDADGVVWHGVPDANTAMLVVANDNPQYRPRGGVVFRVRAPKPSQTLEANFQRARKSEQRITEGGEPMNRGVRARRPNVGRTLHMKPRGAVRLDRSDA
jgi:hypothetical protein